MNFKEKNSRDIYFMKEALVLAEKAYDLGEIPVGAVIVKDDIIISKGYNMREMLASPLSHAEIHAINDAASALSSWRLDNCTLYVTLEPCPMCAGAILNSRVSRLVYGAFDPSSGAAGSVFNLFAMNFPIQPPVITSGVLEKESSEILKKFFLDMRK